jgi:hypothetical protein
MMRVAIVFFLALCLFVLKGHGDVYGNPGHPGKTQQIKFGNGVPGLQVTKNNVLTEKKEDLISIEDDEDVVTSRKYVLPAMYFIVLVYASVSAELYSYLKSSLPFCGHLSFTSSYKYILQRVLRL